MVCQCIFFLRSHCIYHEKRKQLKYLIQQTHVSKRISEVMFFLVDKGRRGESHLKQSVSLSWHNLWRTTVKKKIEKYA